MPVVWCAANTLIIAVGLMVPLADGLGSSRFGYVFELTGSGAAFRQGLALYGVAAAGLGAAFMFIPKMPRWSINRGLAWSTFMLMVLGGVLMLIVPQGLVALAAGGPETATGLARMWSAVWVEAGSKISLAGAIVGAATCLDAWLRSRRVRA
jgi:hypothetical protein